MPWFNYGKRHQRTRVTVHVENYGRGWQLRILGWRTGDVKASLSLLASDPNEIDDFFTRVNAVQKEWNHHHHGIGK